MAGCVTRGSCGEQNGQNKQSRMSRNDRTKLCKGCTTDWGLKIFFTFHFVRKAHIDATSGIRRQLPKTHSQSTHTYATHVFLVFAEIPKMATPHERQVVPILKLQLAHARHDGGAAPVEPDRSGGFPRTYNSK